MPVTTDLRTTKRFEVVVTAPTATFTVTPKSLIDTVPGGSLLWDKVQFHRFDIYGNEDAGGTTGQVGYSPITVTLQNLGTGGWFGDVPTYYSDAVGTFRRAHVGISPNSAFQAQWVSAVDTEPLLTITSQRQIGVTPGGLALVQFTCTLRSTAGAPTSVSESFVQRINRHEPLMLPQKDENTENNTQEEYENTTQTSV